MRTVLLLSGALAVAAPAYAQYPPIRNPYVTVTYGGVSRSQEAHQRGVVTLYDEVGVFDVRHSIERAGFIEIGLGARVWRGLFIGGDYSARRTETRDGLVTAFIAHPVFYGAFRMAEGTAGLEHREHAVHVAAMWRFEPTPRFQIGLFGGPSIFYTSHDLIETFTVEEGGAQVTIGEPTRRRESESVFGAHAGMDATYRAVGQLGVGAMVRYSRGSAAFSVPGKDPIGFRTGGLDAGVRLRIGF